MTDLTVVRTRFAPSPTGHLHVGGARTALFCWAFARGRNGKFILRIEDTDQKRSSESAAATMLDDLCWLGLHWDEGPEWKSCGGGAFGPYFQSERRDLYDRCILELLDGNLAYRAFETSEELEVARSRAASEKRSYRFDGPSQTLDRTTSDRLVAEGRAFVVRLRVPDGPVVIHDRVRGDVTVPAEKLDDFVIRKADGFPTYHFAVVVDDETMGVTHVIRGEEHLNNTAKHILLQNALGFRRPIYAHLSLIFNPAGSKMSKREKDQTLRAFIRANAISRVESISEEALGNWLEDKDVQLDAEDAIALSRELHVPLPEIDVEDFRRAGYLPEVLLNYLALLGWSPPDGAEKFDLEYLIAKFDLDRLNKSAARFDRDKLLAFNHDAIQAMSPDEFERRYRDHIANYHPDFAGALSDDRTTLLARANQSRAKTLDDTLESCRFFIQRDDEIVYERSKPVRKALAGGDPSGFEHLERLRNQLATLDPWTLESIEQSVRGFADEHAAGKLGDVAQPLRIAVSGSTVSPAIFETLAILGRESVLARIDRCLAFQSVLLSGASGT